MKFYNLAIFFFISLGLYAQKWDESAVISEANVSAIFLDVEKDKEYLSYNADKVLNPASTIKLLSCYTILEEKGADFQYKTYLLYNGKIDAGVLKGDLIIRGTGDPSLGSTRYGNENSTDAFIKKCVAYAKKQGISCIDGNIVIDASAWGSDAVPHSWPYNDLGNYYAAGAYAININENSYKLSIDRKGNKISDLYINPEVPRIYFTNELELGPANSGDQAYIFCAPFQDQAYVRGSIPKGKGLFSIRGSMPNPALFLGESLQKGLSDAGIKSQKVEVEFSKERKGKIIYTHLGIPLNKLVKSAIQKSINLYCEAFLKTLGNGNREKGIEKITSNLLKRKIINSKDDIQIADGSGLSQRNFISARQQAMFLKDQYLRHKDLKSTLARNGKDGTLKYKFTSASLKGRIWGKSGSMGNVRAYTGIIKTNSNKELSFCIMVNNYLSNYKKVDAHIQKLLEQAVRL